jgi:rubrerythrin
MNAFRSVDQVLDFAINREVEAHDFYMKLASMAAKPEMARVMSTLAWQEQEHKAKLEAVKSVRITIGEDEIGNLGISSHVEDVEPQATMSYVDLLVVGMKKEEKARMLYTNLASMARKQEIKDIFLKLAREEAEHKLRFEIEYDLMTF